MGGARRYLLPLTAQTGIAGSSLLGVFWRWSAISDVTGDLWGVACRASSELRTYILAVRVGGTNLLPAPVHPSALARAAPERTANPLGSVRRGDRLNVDLVGPCEGVVLVVFRDR